MLVCDVCSASDSAFRSMHSRSAYIMKGSRSLLLWILKLSLLSSSFGSRMTQSFNALQFTWASNLLIESKWCKHWHEWRKNFIVFYNWKGNESIHYNIVYRSQMYFFPLCLFNCELMSWDFLLMWNDLCYHFADFADKVD